MSNGSARLLAGALLCAAILVGALSAERVPPSQPAPALRAALPGYVRVLLSDNGATASLGGHLQWLDGLKILGMTDGAVDVAAHDGQVRIRLGGKARDAARLIAVPVDGYLLYGGRSYRGRAECFSGKAGGVALLNVLPLEDYLCGVVPSEMPAGWPADALRAQAVAARTYAVQRLQDQADATYDVMATVADQEYHGVSGEAPAATQAVLDTAGQILTYRGAPIAALYCSDAGGCTAPGQFDYLQPVYSFAPDSKWKCWQLTVTLEQLIALAKKAGADIGKPDLITTENDPVSGHLLHLTLSGSQGDWQVGGKQLRSLLGTTQLRSTRVRLYPASEPGDPPPVPTADDTGQPIYVEFGTTAAGRDGAATPQPFVTTISAKEAQAGLVFIGCGNGHGVGMSQYGAEELAKQGWAYRDILLYFYRGVQLAQLPPSFTAPAAQGQYCTNPASEEAAAGGFYEPFQKRTD